MYSHRNARNNLRRLGRRNAVLVSGLGEKFRLDSFLRTVIRELRVEGVVPRLSAVGADLDGAEVDEVETLARKQRLANPAAPRAEMGDTVRARRGV